MLSHMEAKNNILFVITITIKLTKPFKSALSLRSSSPHKWLHITSFYVLVLHQLLDIQ